MISFLFWAIPTHSAQPGPGCGREGQGRAPEQGEGIWTWLPPFWSRRWSHPRRKPLQKEHTLSVLKGSKADRSVALGRGATRESENLPGLSLTRSRRRHPVSRPGVFIRGLKGRAPNKRSLGIWGLPAANFTSPVFLPSPTPLGPLKEGLQTWLCFKWVMGSHSARTTVCF